MFNLKLINDVLREKGRSVQWLADELGFKNPAIYKMFATNTTTIKTLERICEILSISPVRLLDGNQTNSLQIQNKGEFMTNEELMFFYNQLRKDYDSERGRVDTLIDSVSRFSKVIGENPIRPGQKKAV